MTSQKTSRHHQQQASFPILASDQTCTGCAACANVCHAFAITMQWNADGFLHPHVDIDLCVNCTKCTRTCPVISEKGQKGNVSPIMPPDAYAGWSLDTDVRKNSSSGGIFTELALYVLRQQGIVVGALMDVVGEVRHSILRSEEELPQLRGAKYVQSFIGHELYRQIASELKKGVPVLFSGTPCQIAGLKSFLGKDYANLILCDIVCHGVPSRKLLQRYMQDKQEHKRSAIRQLCFRDKSDGGWQNYGLSIVYDDQTREHASHRSDVFMRGFLKDLGLNEACYQCRYSGLPHHSDITLGDFWGVEQLHPDWDLHDGASLVLVHTDKGKDILRNIGSNIFVSPEPLHEALYDNASILKSCQQPENREKFLEDLSGEKSLDEIVQKHASNVRCSYDVGIVGIWYSCNYGAILNGFATMSTLNQLGYSAVLIDTAPLSGARNQLLRFTDISTPFRRFAKRWLHTTPSVSHPKELKDLNQSIRIFASGSDQIWNIENCCGQQHLDDCFLLRFVDPNKKKIAIASSFGHDKDLRTISQVRQAQELLSSYDAISVREDTALDILKTQYGLEGTHLLDPVFLCDREKFDRVAALAPVQRCRMSYMASYLLDPTADKRAILQDAARELGLEQVHMLDAQFDFEAKRQQLDIPGIEEDLLVEQFVHNIANSRYLITDSFHGVCFAIIYRKEFICIGNRERGMSRFLSLFKQLGLESRMVFTREEVLEAQLLQVPIDYDEVYRRLEHHRGLAIAWLKEALESPLGSQRTDCRKPLRGRRGQASFSLSQQMRRMSVLAKLAKALIACRLKERKASGKERHLYRRKQWFIKQQLRALLHVVPSVRE